MTQRKWVATINVAPNGQPEQRVRLGIAGNKRDSYYIVSDGGYESSLHSRTTYEEALNDLAVHYGSGTEADRWKFKWLESR